MVNKSVKSKQVVIDPKPEYPVGPKPEYPIVAVYAFDWAGATSTTENFDKEEIKENIKPINAWIAGMLVEEKDEFIVICQTYFNDAKNHRCPIAISKKTILHRIDY